MELWAGHLLRLDLDTGRVTPEEYRPHRRSLGGQGLNQRILISELAPGTDPLGPDNILALGGGGLVGTAAPGASRTNIDTLSPLTGGIGSANSGGHFSGALRAAGWHNVILKGRARQLSYLRIDDQRVDLVEAAHLKGMTISQASRVLRDELGPEYSLLLIGPAGENLVRSACIIVDGARSASRCGVGAVMGSKNLKAVAVRGSGRVEPARPEEFGRAVQEMVRRLRAHPMVQGLSQKGIYANETFLDGIESPYRNFSGRAVDPAKRARIAPEHFLDLKVNGKTCGGCPIGCWKVYRTDGPGLQTSEGLHINAIHNFAARLDMFDPKTVLRAHALCNDLGLDQDNATSAIAWAFDCFEQGLISRSQADGRELVWGRQEEVFGLIRDIAHRRGLGDLLAEGCRRAARHFPGSEELCVHIKGQELFESIWISPAWALGTAVAARGGTHTRGAVLSNRLEGMPVENCQRLFGIDSVGRVTSYENKEKLVVFFELLQAVTNSLGVCYFTHGLFLPDMLLPEDFARLYSAASGEGISASELLWLGERIFNLEKCFNLLHTDWTRADDRPPDLFFERPLDGRYRLEKEAWEELLTRYYRLHGWDQESGRPTPETLTRLELEPLGRKLSALGRLPAGEAFAGTD